MPPRAFRANLLSSLPPTQLRHSLGCWPRQEEQAQVVGFRQPLAPLRLNNIDLTVSPHYRFPSGTRARTFNSFPLFTPNSTTNLCQASAKLVVAPVAALAAMPLAGPISSELAVIRSLARQQLSLIPNLRSKKAKIEQQTMAHSFATSTTLPIGGSRLR